MQDASIIGAQIFSTRDGRAIDTFRLRRAFTSDEDEKVRATRIIDTVKQLLQGKRTVLIDLGKESRHNRRLKPFALPAQVAVSNAISEKFTVIEVAGSIASASSMPSPARFPTSTSPSARPISAPMARRRSTSST